MKFFVIQNSIKILFNFKFDDFLSIFKGFFYFTWHYFLIKNFQNLWFGLIIGKGKHY